MREVFHYLCKGFFIVIFSSFSSEFNRISLCKEKHFSFYVCFGLTGNVFFVLHILNCCGPPLLNLLYTSLHLTTFCLQYKPTVIACVCIHLACKWSNWEIPVSTDGKHWWEYVDPTVTLELLDGKQREKVLFYVKNIL